MPRGRDDSFGLRYRYERHGATPTGRACRVPPGFNFYKGGGSVESLPWGFESQNAAVVDAGARERERWSDCGGCALELEVGRSHSQPTALGGGMVWLWVPVRARRTRSF